MKITLHGNSKESVNAAEEMLRADPTPGCRLAVMAIYRVKVSLGSQVSPSDHAQYRVHKAVTL